MNTPEMKPAERLQLPVRGFALRLAASTSCLIVATCASLSWFLVQRNLDEVARSSFQRIRTIAEQLAQNAELGILSGDRLALEELAQHVGAEREVVYVHFVDHEGRSLVASDEPQPPPNPAAVAPGETVGPIDVYANVWEIHVPIFTTGPRGQREELGFGNGYGAGKGSRQQIGTLVMGASRESLHALRSRMLATAAAMTAIVVLFGVFLAAVSAQSLTRPLKSLATATEAITQGHLNATVAVRRNDEIGALASSFNTMVQSLARSRAELEEHSRNLEETVRARTDRLEALNDELREANRLKSEFLATVSHELRTPLHVILGYAAMLAEGGLGAVTPEQYELLDAVQRYSKLQLDLLTDVLDFSRLTSGRVSYRVERFDLASLVHDIQHLYQGRLASGQVLLDIKLQPDLPPLDTDRIKLQEIIRNLVDNAVKFTDSGTVVLSAYASTAASITIEVCDTGRGIPKAELPYVFEPFHQGGQGSTRNTGGVGLGLSIVKQLCQALGGSISVISELGVGSAFRVEIPRCLPNDAGDAEAPPTGAVA